MTITIVALVPAAGRSERMGRPKLTLGLGGESVIQRVVRSLEQGGASEVVVVAPPIPDAAAVVLANHARVEGAFVVHLATPTHDMRGTVEFGLHAIEEHGLAPDGILLTPADVPGISPRLVAEVVKRFRSQPGKIVLPTHAGKRGHPIAIPWEAAHEIHQLPPGTGVNALLNARPGDVLGFEIEDPRSFEDLDTPDDYQRWIGGQARRG